MKVKHISGFVLSSLLLLGGYVSNASAELITNIPGLNIGGVSYDVTFHPNKSFQELWDADGDFVFGESDSSLFNAAPTFWGNPPGSADAAEVARDVLIAFFPSDGTMGTATFVNSFLDNCDGPPNFCDGFLIPYGASLSTPGNVSIAYEAVPDPARDLFATGSVDPGSSGILPLLPFASFERSSTALPEPTTLALLGLGLAAVGWARRTRAQ